MDLQTVMTLFAAGQLQPGARYTSIHGIEMQLACISLPAEMTDQILMEFMPADAETAGIWGWSVILPCTRMAVFPP